MGHEEDRARYPAHWEADVVLRDGTPMHIRPIAPTDADALQRFHVRQSPESTYFRFFAPMERLSERDLAHLTTVDHRDRVAFVLVHGGEIVAVGRYDRITDVVAEVAFNVADALQGRGLGSVLLEHLAAAARERGIRRFVADVLPGNARMINVFRDAGYDVSQAYEDGVLSVAFDIDPTVRSLAVMAEREHHAEARSMRALLNPASVLVVAEGAAPLAQQVARAVLASPFDGPVHLVGAALADLVRSKHGDPDRAPARGTLHPSLDAVPVGVDLASVDLASVDLAVVDAPADVLPEIARRCAQLGVHGLVVLSGGFAEIGPAGAARQRALLRAARDGGMRLVGPQSLGVIAAGPAGRLDATLGQALPPTGGLSLFCQSAVAGLALLAGATRRGLGVATFLSAGNRADVSGNDAMQFWLDHAPTRIGCVYLESIGNPRKFTRVARRLSATTPVVAVVSGQTGQVVPPGHPVRTSREPRRVLEELLRQAGVIRAENLHEMFDVVQLLASQPLPLGDRVAVLTNAATLSTQVAEVARARGLTAAADPVSLDPLAGAEAYRQALTAFADRTDWDALIVVSVPMLGPLDGAVCEAIAAAPRDGRPVLATVTGLHGLTPELTGEAGTVPAFSTAEDAVQALASAVRYAAWSRADRGMLSVPRDIAHQEARALARTLAAGVREGGSMRLDRHDAARLLDCYGVGVVPTASAATPADALAAADGLGWPVAVKARDPHLRHRLDLGGVRLDVATPEELAEAFAHLGGGDAEPRGVDVQTMVPRGVSCVVRSSEDELYGPVVAFGLAGDATELLGDVAYRIPPLTDVDVRDMVRSVRAAPRLFGHRGAPQADVAALEDLVARVAALADDLPEVARCVLEPVVVASSGLAVLDARIDITRPARVDGSRRVLPG